jgi:hypothetical protein
MPIRDEVEGTHRRACDERRGAKALFLSLAARSCTIGSSVFGHSPGTFLPSLPARARQSRSIRPLTPRRAVRIRRLVNPSTDHLVEAFHESR